MGSCCSELERYSVSWFSTKLTAYWRYVASLTRPSFALLLQLDAGELAGVTLHHVVAESGITEVVKEHVEVSLHYGLHVGAVVVKVAHAVPVVARVFIAAEANLWCLFVSPCQSSSLVIITADVGRIHLVGSAFISFCGEVGPAGERVAMIDYHIGYGADALALEGADHGAQFGFVAERAVVIAEPIEVVISH